ncbi:MAG: hypothetical protein ISS70_14570 [Phycisphaerae bacterium]|nr:hypothetical protein [Phycisphaerae bacterium]
MFDQFCVPLFELLYKFPRFAETPWSFLKVSNKIEGGLPHTQGRHIVLCEGVCGRFASRYKTAPDRAVSSLAGLMIHEQMHVFQRANPEMFDALYTEIWGFIKAEELVCSESRRYPEPTQSMRSAVMLS